MRVPGYGASSDVVSELSKDVAKSCVLFFKLEVIDVFRYFILYISIHIITVSLQRKYKLFDIDLLKTVYLIKPHIRNAFI